MDGRLAIEGGAPVRSKPWPKWPLFSAKDKQDLAAVLDDGRLTSITGPKVREFEEKYAACFGAKHAVACSSGVTALHLALSALQIGPGDEVIVPAHTFIGTAIPVLMANAIPIFVDIRPDTFNLDPERLEEAITPRTRAIMPVHLNGLPADMEAIRAVAGRHNLHLIEDACQAHGARYRGRPAGTLAELAAFSFFEDKVITTGEGGMVLTDSEELFERARAVRSYGEVPSGEGGERRYEHLLFGFNYRMGALNAALGINQLDRLEEMVEKRNRNARFLRRQLGQVPGIVPPAALPDCRHAYYKFVCRLDPQVVGRAASEFAAALKAEGIPATPRYPTPLPLQQVFRERLGYGRTSCPYDCDKYGLTLDYTSGSWPESERAGREAFVLLVHPSVEEADLQEAADAVAKVATSPARR
jgi:perosamine synthetase